MRNSDRTLLTLIAITLVVFVAGLYIREHKKNTPITLDSRQVMERAMDIVREEKPTPPQSSRFYAVVARNYYEHPGMGATYSSSTLRETLKKIVAEDSQVITSRPEGDPYWNGTMPPFSPNAGSGKRFILDEEFTYTVPEPPVFGSEVYQKALKEVADAAANRTLEQSAAINFWGGVPGTEAPAGIWQNRLWNVSKKYNLSDKEYAYVQMVLAESVADAFMECWKTKYIYWTKRPDMVDPTIQTAMPNPPFPSYVSGHSTISFTAATVLAAIFPEDAETYLRDAEEAKNSRLWAGIHFSHDNEEGKKMGIAIGNYIAKKLDLENII